MKKENAFNFDFNLFRTERIVALSGMKGSEEVFLCDEGMVEAIETNEKLIKNYNYKLTIPALLDIARYRNGKELLKKMRSFTVFDAEMSKAKAMYSGEQAHTIETAIFRFHQMLHYASTYGLEYLTGQEVSHGWLPENDSEGKELTEDRVLLSATEISIIPEEDKYLYVFKKIAGRKNRATLMEQEMLEECVKNISLDALTDIPVAFKENYPVIFKVIFENTQGEKRAMLLKSLCSNTNDVLRCLREILSEKKWSLKTSEKRSFVKLLESFPVSDFKENIMKSKGGREKVIVILQYLDYNTYSRSQKHKELVAALRAGTLNSWEGEFKKLLKNDKKKALVFAAKRPGFVNRNLNYLLKEGISADDIIGSIKENASKLSTQTLIENMTTFSKPVPSARINEERRIDLMKITEALLHDNLAAKETILKNKKVYVDSDVFDLDKSVIQFNKKSEVSDYIASGLARKIDNVGCRYIRIFCYWEDADVKKVGGYRTRVDIDLHAYGMTANNELVHIGWNSAHRKDSICHSGDVTTSSPYGCEFIDVDLEKTNCDLIVLSIHNFTGQPFKYVKNLRVGIIGISEMGLENKKKLYNEKNAFFCHRLENLDCKSMVYGTVDIKNKLVYFKGEQDKVDYRNMDVTKELLDENFFISEYLDILFDAQNVERVETPEEADVILKMSKAGSDKEVSLIEENYFADAK